MVSERAKSVAWSRDVAQTSVSGVRRIDQNVQAFPARIPSALPPSAPDAIALELEQARTELAATRVELAAAKAKLARLRGAVEPLRQPGPDAPEPERIAHHATLQNVVVTRAAPLPHQVAGDSRQATRYPVEFEVEFADDTHFIAGVSNDMSTGGMFVATYRSMPVGSAVTLAFDLPSGPPVEVRGEVRWARETEQGDSRPGLGIAFTDLSAAALARIVEFCRGRPPLCFEI